MDMCLAVYEVVIKHVVSRLFILAGLLAVTTNIAMPLPASSSTELSTGSNPASTATAVEKTTARSTLTQPATLSVLHIEDNPENLTLMRRMFASMQNLTLLDAHTGEFGIKLATANPPALILLDMTLPGIDGQEVLRRLRNHPVTRDIPVVAITNNSRALGVELGLADFDDYIVKPVNYDRLQAVLNRRLADGIRRPLDPATVVKQ
ncbi:MAG: response regulator [Gammaproteobacteria bacterium]|nr:response regulator [Gammaproteobacteria bacterium]